MTTFEQFAAECRPALLRFAAVLTNDRYLGEDLVQDVLLRAQLKWPRISELEKPAAYARKMLVNEFVSWRRKWARITPSRSEVIAERVDGEPHPDFADHQAEHDALISELARLPRRQRAVVVLKYLEDLPDREIAEILGCTESTVRSNTARALTSLRIERVRVSPDGATEPITVRRHA